MEVKTIGEKLRHAREWRDMTQTELSKLAGVPLSTIRSIEKNEVVNPGINTIEDLSMALNINPIYFNRKHVFAPWDLENDENLSLLFTEDVKNALKKKEFIPYINITHRAFTEGIPLRVLEKIMEGMLALKKN